MPGKAPEPARTKAAKLRTTWGMREAGVLPKPKMNPASTLPLTQ